MREELFLVLELREEKQIFTIVEGGEMDFFLEAKTSDSYPFSLSS